MKLKTTTKILIALFLIGLCLAAYPKLADYWNTNYTTRAINTYVAAVTEMDEDRYREVWEDARAYNRCLYEGRPEEAPVPYEQCLNAVGNGLMGYLDIGKLGILLPLYHGTSDTVLQTSVGHIDWSSLPTGGADTHAVFSGHRGLATAKLFTDLDQLREGDTFQLSILNEIMTYEVDQIRTVLPDEISDLAISPGKDLCTLVTCTPYGINTHRLLVRGHRIANVPKEARVVADGVVIDELVVAPVVAFPFLFLLFMMVMLKKPRRISEDDEDTTEP